MDAQHLVADDARGRMHPSARERGTSDNASVALESGMHGKCKGEVEGGRKRQMRLDEMKM